MSTLTSLLARDAIVSVDAIEQALQREVLEGGEIDTALLELDAADENVLASYRAASFQLDPATREDLMKPDAEALGKLNAQQAAALGVVPLALHAGRLLLGTATPPNARALAQLAEEIGTPVELRIGTEVRVSAALATHYEIEPSSRLRRLAAALDARAAGELTDVVPPSEPPRDDGLQLPPPPRMPSDMRPADGTSQVRVVPMVALGGEGAEAPAAVGKGAGSAAAKGGSGVAKAAPADLLDDDTRPARPSKLPPPTISRASSLSPSGRPKPRASVVPHGPITRETTAALLDEARGRDAVLEVLFGFARQYFECTVLFTLREGHLLGLEASGLRAAVDPRTFDVAFDRDSSIHATVMSQLPRVINLSKLEADAPLLRAIGRDDSQPAALVPVAIRKRIVALLYGDRDGERFEVLELADLIETLPDVTRAFERIIQEHKVLVMQSRRHYSGAPPVSRSSAAPRGSFSARAPAVSTPPSVQPGVATTTTQSFVSKASQGGLEPVRAEAAVPLPSTPPKPMRPPRDSGGHGTNPGMQPVRRDTPMGVARVDADAPGSPAGPRERREERLSRANEPFQRSPIGAQLTQNALRSLGVRGAAPAPPASGSGLGPSTDDDEFEARPTVQLASTEVLGGVSPSEKPPPGSGSYSHRPGVRRAGRDRDVTRPSRAPRPAAEGEVSANREGDKPTGRPPPRTLSQPPPGTGSYTVREGGTEQVTLPSQRPARAASRPAPARAPDERIPPRRSERPPGPPPGEGAREQAMTPGPVAAPAAPARAADPDKEDPRKTAPARASNMRADPRREAGDAGGLRTETVSIPPRVSESLLPPPPSEDVVQQEMVIDLGAEAERLVSELARCAPDDEGPHVAALLRLGDAALEALTVRFPGGLWFNRNQAHKKLPAGRDVSAVARALYAFEDAAAPYLARLLQSSRPDVRLYAILLAAERVLPELLWPLHERVFDSDGGVRLLMYDTLPLYRNVEGFDQVLASLRTRAADDNAELPNRLAALEAISVLRDPGSLELLWDLSNHSSRQLSVPATRALTALVAQDFGSSARKWRSWVSKHGDKHRVQWLIEGLMHTEERIREIAAIELQKLTQVYYGYSAGASRRDRDRVKKRYDIWWETTGRRAYAGDAIGKR